MSEFMELLPFLLPLAIAEVVLLGYTIYHILTHKNYKRGNRTLWLIVVIIGMQFVTTARLSQISLKNTRPAVL